MRCSTFHWFFGWCVCGLLAGACDSSQVLLDHLLGAPRTGSFIVLFVSSRDA